jgi:hypothetical protein
MMRTATLPDGTTVHSLVESDRHRERSRVRNEDGGGSRLGVAYVSATLVCLLACTRPAPSAELPPGTEIPAAEPVAPLPDHGIDEAAAPPVEAGVVIEPLENGQPAVGTGTPICDEYLELYRRCEQHLMPAIMAGNRRSHHSEAASLRYFASTPEAAGLPSACQSMLDQLGVDCPEQYRQP